jgi:preprotein translocase subunit SecA
MAGRGTDIKLGPGVKEAGGLAIIGTERHESRRVDRQLRGRAGRQGDPGSSQFYVSLEDDLMRMFGSDRIASLMDRMGYKEGEVIQHSMITKSIERAQKKVEENNFGIRKRLLEYDDVMNKQRSVVYGKRSHALFGERLALDLDNAFYGVASQLVNQYAGGSDHEGFKLAAIMHFSIDTTISAQELEKGQINDLSDKLYKEAINHYQFRKQNLAKQALPVFQNVRLTQGNHIVNVVVPVTDGKKTINILTNLDKTISSKGLELSASMEKNITLAIIDDSWKEHLRAMDDLKQSVQTAVYEQKDPLVIYKQTAFGLFSNMDGEVNREIVSFLCHAGLPLENNNGGVREGRESRTDMSNMKIRKDSVESQGPAEMMEGENEYHDPSNIRQEPVRVGPKVGRNDVCPCGSGKKFKSCHGRDQV